MLKGRRFNSTREGGWIESVAHWLIVTSVVAVVQWKEDMTESTYNEEWNHQPPIANHTLYQLNHTRDERKRNTLGDEANFVFIKSN